MKTVRHCFRVALCSLTALALVGILSANSAAAADEKDAEKTNAKDAKGEVAAEATPAAASTAAKSSSSATEAAPVKKPKFPPYADVFRDADEPVPGLIKTRRKGGTLYAEISPGQLNKDFIVVISIARGIGHSMLLGGMSWNFGDDWVWQFRKVDDYIHVVRRNIRFSAAKGSPEERALQRAYTDSILFSLPITTMSPSGAYVVDLNSIFMGDLPQISQILPGFSFSPQRSTWASAKGFPDNVELEVAATYASSGREEIDSVPDSRGATINVHYSISYLPQNGYRPRLADDRVGYFVTVIKDFSQKPDDEQFIRYINRWDLSKADPSAEISPPKKPIVFWLEKTIPYKYRAPIREGILEWNKAFEKAGLANAIEVRQQPDNADWEPEDINYNTFRWITSNAKMAMGPSRVNPTNGQILDADIIFDADFMQVWNTEYETFTPASVAALTGGPLDLESYRAAQKAHRTHGDHGFCPDCNLASGRALDFALGSTALLAKADGTRNEAEREKMMLQGLKEVAMHELGHTLGLRHNFKASSYRSISEIYDADKQKDGSIGSSVMDYLPAVIAPNGKKQGDYFSTTIGPYDMWAIEYGYKTGLGGSPDSEKKELNKVAARSGEPALQYATDEDTRGIDGDPLSNRYDLGKNNIEFAKQRAELISGLWDKVIDRVVKDGEGYERGRQAFGMLLAQYGRSMHFASRYVGGVYLSRSHKADAEAAAPFVVVDAKLQRDTLTMLEEQVFSDKPFKFPPEMYNKLTATRWNHWGMNSVSRPDYPVHEVIALWQGRILDQLLSSLTLERLHDSELKVADDKEAFTTAELISRLTKVVFSEMETLQGGEFTTRKPAVSSLRRNLQRDYLMRLSRLALGTSSAPEDCQTIAFMELKTLQERMNKLLASNVKLDDYTKAHLTESSARISKVLDAKMDLRIPTRFSLSIDSRYGGASEPTTPGSR